MDYGIKVVETGVSINTTDIRQILLSSKYSMLKYSSDTSPSITLSPGDTDKYVDVNHNLGYVPAFIAYYVDSGNSYFIPSLGRSAGFSQYTYAWADSTKVRVGCAYSTGAYNQITYSPASNQDYWHEQLGAPGLITVGTRSGGDRNGAVRVPSVNLGNSETIVSATLDYAVEIKGSGSGDMKIQTWGIDEDNTALFSSNPMGRTDTTAVTTQNVSLPATGQYFGINVKSQVEEITTRAGWSAGNAMGFHIRNNASPADVWAEDDGGTGIDFKLSIVFGTSKTINFRVIIFKDKISS